MKVIHQSFEVLGECPVEHIPALKWIENIGRRCYQSQDKITDDSYEAFVRMLCEKEHGAMIEHSNLVIEVGHKQAHLERSRFIYKGTSATGKHIYAGNYRAFMEASGYTSVNQLLNYEVAKVPALDIPWWAKAVSVKFITDRAVSHELVRHRPASFAQLSQRYVDHVKGLEFIMPWMYWNKNILNAKYDVWYRAMEHAEKAYRELRAYGESPQEARSVLPNATATEIVVTANLPEWEHIFKLRCAPAAYPMMRALMNPLKQEFLNRSWAV